MRQWVVDTDGGVDDAQALVLALRAGPQHGFQVKAVTAVAGNVELDQVTKNVRECLRVCDCIHVPCHAGASRPLVATPFYAKQYHGVDGLGGYWSKVDPKAPLPPVSDVPAVTALIDLANSGPISVIAIGPLTNLAIAALIDPSFPSKLERVVIMGAAETGNGNVNIVAEFNIAWDPEAAHIVFERFPRVEVVSWECTIDPRNRIPSHVVQRYMNSDSPAGYFIKNCKIESKSFFCDPLAMVVAIEPCISLSPASGRMSVVLDGTSTRGLTLFVRGHSTPNAILATALDMQRVFDLFLESIA